MDDEITIIRVVIPSTNVVRITTASACIGGGGSGTPGGSNTEVQYNNSGAFGGISGVTTNGASLNASLPLYSTGDTTDPGGSPYTAQNSGIIVKDVNDAEVFRLWASDPDPSFSNFNVWNVYLGPQSGLAQPSDNVSAGYANTGVGAYTLKSVTEGFCNTAVGAQALESNTTGRTNTAIGFHALSVNTTGNENTAIGVSAMDAATTGSNNVAVGYTALLDITSGIQNVGIGKAAGANSQSDSQMTWVGPFCGRTSTGSPISNSIALGNAVLVDASNIAVIGNGAVTDVYFGSISGAANLHAANLLPIAFFNPGGRLTTESGVPVSTSDRTSQGTLYYTPYKHNKIYTYSGSAWQAKTFSEISLSLTLTSGKNYDVFINSAATTLSLSAAWSNDTTRTDALATQDGVTVLSSDHTKLWIGTIRASGSNVTEDSEGGTVTQVGGKRFVWNTYNQVTRRAAVFDSTVNWSYVLATIRQAGGVSGNKVEYVTGFSTDVIDASLVVSVFLSGNTVACGAGIGIDSTTAFSGRVPEGFYNGATTSVIMPLAAEYRGTPGLGYHYVSWNEIGADTSCFFAGASFGGASGLELLISN